MNMDVQVPLWWDTEVIGVCPRMVRLGIDGHSIFNFGGTSPF